MLIYCLSATVIFAEIPRLINYQGYLTDEDGSPTEGLQLIKFKIYGSESGDDSLWSSGFQTIEVENGLFEYNLGSGILLPEDLFPPDGERYLGITVGVDNEICPRVRIMSVPYAYQTLHSDSAAMATDIADGIVTTDKLADFAVSENKIMNNAVTSSHIQDHTITSGDIGFDEITGDNIHDGTISLDDIGQNDAVEGDILKWRSATGQWEVAPDSIGIGGDITAVNTSDGLTGGGDMGDVTIALADSGVTTGKIADNAVTGDKILDGTITGDDIADSAIIESKIMNNAVSSSKIANGTISSDDIGFGAVDTENIAPNAVSTYKIIDGTIRNADIYDSAAIDREKIYGTAAITDVDYNLFFNTNYYNGDTYYWRNTEFSDNAQADAMVQFFDSTMNVNAYGIRIGDGGVPTTTDVIRINRGLNASSGRTGINLSLTNSGTGVLTGIRSNIEHTTASSGNTAYAIYGTTITDGSTRYGIYGSANTYTSLLGTGLTYGVFGEASGGNSNYGIYGLAASGSYKYGVYGSCGSSTGNYGGYFWGNLHATGSNTKGSGGFIIDHPLDPENKYLSHSDVQSPEMINIYNGNVILDANGEAIVRLPQYFEALNGDFRYQLTCIGGYAPVYIAEKISDNYFIIAGGLPNMEVSWQVTGVRRDAYADSNRMTVEGAKADEDKGFYYHPEAFGLDIEQSVDYQRNKQVMEETQTD